jgi:hypothetical protein
MDRYEPHGEKVYQLNICEAIGDRHSVQESPACTLAISGPGHGRLCNFLSPQEA